MHSYRIALIFLFLLGLPAILCAAVIPYERLAAQPSRTRESQLDEFADVFKPEYDSYLSFGWLYFPFPSQQELKSPYGTHPGFAFRHRFALFAHNPMDSASKYRSGMGWWVERQGWDTEDFLAVPKYSQFGAVRDLHTFVATFSNRAQGWGGALGLQWQNPEYLGRIYAQEEDSLWWFAHATWDKLTLQSVFHRGTWTSTRINMDLADRAIRGGDTTGWKTYMPDIEALLIHQATDPLRLQVRQNVFRRLFYLEGSWWVMENRDPWVSLKAFSDPSHMLGVEIGTRRLDNGDWIWGGGIEMPFLRVSCNLPREYEQFFESRGAQILVEFHLNIGTIDKTAIFARNGADSAPMETDKVKTERKFEKGPDSDGAQPIQGVK